MSAEKTTELTEAILLSLLPDTLIERRSLPSGSDLNAVTQPGCYLIATSDLMNLPAGIPKYATLVVLPGYYLTHMLIPTQSPCLLIRLQTNKKSGAWTKWIKFTGEYL